MESGVFLNPTDLYVWTNRLKIYYFVFRRRKDIIQLWNYMTESSFLDEQSL